MYGSVNPAITVTTIGKSNAAYIQAIWIDSVSDAVFYSPANIALSAIAQNEMQSYAFHANGVFLGESSLSEYIWNEVWTGSYLITATASDYWSTKGTSSAISLKGIWNQLFE